MKRTKMPIKSNLKQKVTSKQESAKTPMERPSEYAGAITAIRKGNIDGRTTHSRRLLAMRKMLGDHSVPATLGLVKDTLAVNAAIVSCLLQEICKADFQLFDKQGNLNPILERYWPETQKAILSASQALLRLEQAQGRENKRTASTIESRVIASGDTTPIDISSLVLELDEDKTA